MTDPSSEKADPVVHPSRSADAPRRGRQACGLVLVSRTAADGPRVDPTAPAYLVGVGILSCQPITMIDGLSPGFSLWVARYETP